MSDDLVFNLDLIKLSLVYFSFFGDIELNKKTTFVAFINLDVFFRRKKIIPTKSFF